MIEINKRSANLFRKAKKCFKNTESLNFIEMKESFIFLTLKKDGSTHRQQFNKGDVIIKNGYYYALYKAVFDELYTRKP